MHAFVLSALPPPPARVLEVGCGAGDLARALDAARYEVVAVDPQAPEGSIFRRTTLEALEDTGPFDGVVAAYVLHHLHDLDAALDRVAALLTSEGRLVLAEFGWDRVDSATAEWYAGVQGRPADAVYDEWRDEHAGLHGYADMRRALDARFEERLFEWRPYLYGCLKRDDLEPDERQAIERDHIRAVGFRYVGVRR